MSQDLRGLAVAHYKLIEPLGGGGLWRAREERLERDVAIKIVFPATSEEEARRELRLMMEAKAAARIHSRHVARVLMLGHTDDGALFVATELLDGVTLQAVLDREKTLELERALRIARDIARGLLAAHTAGVLHRGLEPSRVMLVDDDGEKEVAKIIDFGVAKRLECADAELTQRGELLTGEEYAAPEIKEGVDDIDARVDIYAFGVILKKMVGESAPPKIAAVIARCTAADRDRRYRRIIEVLDALLPSRAEKARALAQDTATVSAAMSAPAPDRPSTAAVLPQETAATSASDLPPPVIDPPQEMGADDDWPTLRDTMPPAGLHDAAADTAITAATAAVLRTSVMQPRIVAAVCATVALCVIGAVFAVVASNAAETAQAQRATPGQGEALRDLVVDVQTVRIQEDAPVDTAAWRRLLAPPIEPEPAPIISELVVTARPVAKTKRSVSKPKPAAPTPVAIQQPPIDDDDDFIRVRSGEAP